METQSQFIRCSGCLVIRNISEYKIYRRKLCKTCIKCSEKRKRFRTKNIQDETKEETNEEIKEEITKSDRFIYTYSVILDMFLSKNCQLLTTEEEFIQLKTEKNNRANLVKVNFIASCGHNNIVDLNSFRHRETGVLCKDCLNQKIKQDLLNIHSQNNTLDTTPHIIQEDNVFEYFENILRNNFIVKKTKECCKADFIIKPKNIEDNKWLLIQLKTTKNMGIQQLN
jgi:hypothetical protein